MTVQTPTPTEDQAASAQARHGYRNEVNWEGGSGRQPYTNQVRRMPSPAAGHEPAEGNLRERSGRSVEQLDQVRRKP